MNIGHELLIEGTNQIFGEGIPPSSGTGRDGGTETGIAKLI